MKIFNIGIEKEPPKLITTWEELLNLPANKNYKIEGTEDGEVWIMPVGRIEELEFGINCEYLSTHLFYGGHYQQSTELLQRYGFNVEIDNWDKKNESIKTEGKSLLPPWRRKKSKRKI